MSTSEAPHSTARRVRRGIVWSSLNSTVLRAGSFITGIVLARLLTPSEFGVYAVALTVQLVLMTLADLGLSADLVRHPDPGPRAPTVAVLGLVSGGFLATVMAVSSPVVAGLMGDASAAPVIAVLALTLVLAGAGVVPYASLVRDFRQRELFAIAVADFLLSTAVTISLIVAGWGPMALAVGRVVAQVMTLVLQFRLSGTRPRFRPDRRVARSVLAFGLPVAAANMLSWGLLNLDNVVIARAAGTTLLGLYVLAFNVSNWPMSVIGQVVRSVALPAFSRSTSGEGGLVRATALTYGLALPAGAALAVVADPLVRVVYGDRWAGSGPVLAALALFGALRVVLDVDVAFLLSRGRSRAVLAVQVLWIVVLLPALVVGVHVGGIVGAGWAHLVVSVAVVVPAYAWALRRTGVPLTPLLHVLVLPSAAAALASGAGWLAAQQVDSPLLELLSGVGAGAVVYLATTARWLRGWAREPQPETPEPPLPTHEDQLHPPVTTHQ